ncbi:hypothetical protein [uncultured Jannaschia sp.]|uniref:hypothetical protein n=1 Tax=uncultured Jannaschia sp. TaxID=293347 RepID=UPI0026154AC9|nr:hypothetical protein [uncultured Jannaschia sp.]
MTATGSGRPAEQASNEPTLLLAAEQRVRQEDDAGGVAGRSRAEPPEEYTEDSDFEHDGPRALRTRGLSKFADLSDEPAANGDLRELVTEIVREELAGELGARITRNVRKLVRQEIARAMSEMEPGKRRP